MEYNIGGITFSKNVLYDRVLYSNLFKIYEAFEYATDDLKYAGCVTGKYNLFLFKNTVDGEVTNDLYNFLYYKELLLWFLKYGYAKRYHVDPPSIESIMNAKSLEELKSIFDLYNCVADVDEQKEVDDYKKWFGVDGNNVVEVEFNGFLKKYYDRIIKAIPQNIFDNIQNKELFKLGYIEKDIYDQLVTFKNELKTWLEHPTGSDLYFDIANNNSYFSPEFHDQLFTTVEKSNKQLEFIGDERIVCYNCKTIFVDSDGKILINDYDNEKDFVFNNVRGYTAHHSIHINNSNRSFFFLEVFHKEISEIIIELDSFKCFNL